MTEPTRQLPGVKGQWILAAECPPTGADADADGDVRIYFQHAQADGHFYHFDDVSPDQYWCPADSKDPRPFTLPAAPAPRQAAEGKRNIDDLMVGTDGVVVAFADDKTAWFIYEQNGGEDYPRNLQWHQLPPLPDREV
jgi:hypothetical protein